MIQRTIGPMQIQDLPDPEVTLVDYALVMTYTGTALFDPSAFIASVFERRYDPTIAENGYYWHRIPGSQHDVPRMDSAAQADFEDVNASDVTQAFHKDVYRHLESLAKRVYKLENR